MDFANPEMGNGDVLQDFDFESFLDLDKFDNDGFIFDDPSRLEGGEVDQPVPDDLAGIQPSRPTNELKSSHTALLRCLDPSCAFFTSRFKSKSGLYKHNQKHHPVPKSGNPPVFKSTEEPAQPHPPPINTPGEISTRPIHELAHGPATESARRTKGEISRA
jgi:hypothetical protein